MFHCSGLSSSNTIGAQQWHHQPSHEQPPRRGARLHYSDLAITMMASLQQIYRLPLRAAQGLRPELPHYSTLARRGRRLSIALRRFNAAKRSIYWPTRPASRSTAAASGCA